ncbi:MAG: TorF family putative porin [Pseudomonadota bacterium]
MLGGWLHTAWAMDDDGGCASSRTPARPFVCESAATPSERVAPASPYEKFAAHADVAIALADAKPEPHAETPSERVTPTSPYERFATHADVVVALADAKPEPHTDPKKPAPAHPQGFSFNVAVVSDYRRAGATRSDHQPAFQLGADFAAGPWSVGAFASTIAKKRGAHAEVDYYAARSFSIGNTDLSLGGTYVTYPGGQHTDYAYAQASVSRVIGPVDTTLAVVYGPPQANLDHEHGLYVGARARTPIGRIGDIPLTLGASIGRASGGFTFVPTKVDWSLSLTADVHGLDVGVSYVDTDTRDRRGSPAAVFSVRRRF